MELFLSAFDSFLAWIAANWFYPLMALVALIAVILFVVIVRALLCHSRQPRVTADELPALPDRVEAVRCLSGAVRIPTFSNVDIDKVNAEDFERFIAYLAKSFPEFHKVATLERVSDFSLVYRWQGSDETLKPALFISHMDVVGVPEDQISQWSHEPFSGDVSDGFIWGRGTLDMKGILISIMEAAETLAKSGTIPKRTMYFALGQDEEVGGLRGANVIAQRFADEGLTFEYVLDEGLMITTDSVPGVKQNVALVGTCERGYIDLCLTVEATGGHSSAPPKDTAIGILSRAVERIENAPFKAHMTGAAMKLFKYTAHDMNPLYRAVFSNLWLTAGIVRGILTSAPTTKALVCTSVSPTIFNAGSQANVLPSEASCIFNARIMPGEDKDSVIKHLNKAIKDPRVHISEYNYSYIPPTPVSNDRSRQYKAIAAAIRRTFPDVLVAPTLCIAGTDSPFYSNLTDCSFRFSPQVLSSDGTSLIHGIDERLDIEDYLKGIEFYERMILS